ncbi:CBL-interacting serine/threonine-protein kinase 4 [Acorus calamus]|uniref:CBL-interacting serine/threonine-protein kinase 4 n=1 Tax=Acorus calamus TaxID=4465 RepID=A0AAV9CEV3_ACOCL|nr:CBL-interacting serine/threonine-protein kinase 4 [Acorus calamus]
MKTPTTTTKEQQQQQPLLGKYILGRLLGRGTFAKVYHARSTAAAASEVAIKVIDKSKLPSAASARVLSEVSAMRALKNHPNIVNLREVMATKTKIYLVMDYVQGGDLHSTLIRKGGRLSEILARKYFAQLVTTLRFCHSLGVAHRDVKPQNLLLDRDGSLKVSDFGLSALGDILSLRTACGTPAYTAPEVLAMRGYDGARADAWSCGVILYVFIAGRLPFDDSNIGLMYRKIRRREFGFPGWFPPQARRVVLRLLDPNPETRIGLDAVAELAWLKRRASDVRCGGVGLGEEKAMMARVVMRRWETEEEVCGGGGVSGRGVGGEGGGGWG